MRRLGLGKCYQFGGWLFAVVRERDERSVDVLTLDHPSRAVVGGVVTVRHRELGGLALELP